MPTMTPAPAALHDDVLAWYAAHRRDLPWRRPDASAWHVLVSEVMLQQTPVVRVLPVYAQWVRRWPTPAALAAAPLAEVIRAWGRLGYPRRAMRLHACATACVQRHDGDVPDDIDLLRALPGVGDYTAAAVASFAYGQRHPVLDTNVRRVLGRVLRGEALPRPSLTVAERRSAEGVVPVDAATAATWAVAVMELGALVCTARSPRCDECPIRDRCRWRLDGHPAYDGPPRRTQAWHGTDRQCRGRIMARLRDATGPIPVAELRLTWDDAAQLARAVDGLVADGLVEAHDEMLALP